MNVATGQGVMAVNPANLWFPVGDGKLKLIHANDRKRSITEKREDDNEWSGVFIIGVFKEQVIFRSNFPRKQSPKGALLANHNLCINQLTALRYESGILEGNKPSKAAILGGMQTSAGKKLKFSREIMI